MSISYEEIKEIWKYLENNFKPEIDYLVHTDPKWEYYNLHKISWERENIKHANDLFYTVPKLLDVIIRSRIKSGNIKEEDIDTRKIGERTVNDLSRFYTEILARVIGIEILKKNKIPKNKLKKMILEKIRSENEQICLL